MRLPFLLVLTTLLLTTASAQPSLLAQRLSPALRQRLMLMREGDSLLVSVLLQPAAGVAKQYRLQPQYAEAGIFTGRLSKKEMLALHTHPAVVFIGHQAVPKEELNTGAVDYTLNGITRLRALYPHRGDSVVVSVKERAFDTADIDLKGRVIVTGLQAPQQTAHASVMATIIGGAGNSSPFAQGVAPAALLGSANFANLFPEPDAFYRQQKISVQNHSYGTVVESFYGNEAYAYDRSMTANPTLVQVFSAGNAGASAPSSGPYKDLPGWANLTGNFKQSKNSLVVAALDSLAQPMAAASRGPAYDGRLKPELSAYGEDGSSGAAALVSGTAAVVQEAYKKQVGHLPTADLVKAVLLNSADDVGAVGPDYRTGFGSLNAPGAVGTVLQNRFFSGQVAAGQTVSFPLTIPAGVALAKITLCWLDPAAQPTEGKALVNDLDLVVRKGGSGAIWHPWVLNPVAAADSLLKAATRRRDTLNNAEQLTIDTPAAGEYFIDVSGTNLATAQQAFSIAYGFDTAAQVQWTYPMATDALQGGRTISLRWHTTVAGTGDVQYTTDGARWITIASNVTLSSKQVKWAVPDTVAVARLRLLTGVGTVLSDSFALSPQPGLSVGFVCADSALLYWRKLPATRYTLYRLRGNYLERFITVADTAVVINTAASRFYAVAPVVAGRPAFRSNSIPFDSAGVGCYLVTFYLQSQTTTAASFAAELGTLFNVRLVNLQKLTAGGVVTVQTIAAPGSSQLFFTNIPLTPGENPFRLQIVLQDGTSLLSPVENVYQTAARPVYVYPNPVRRGEGIRIISNQAGRFTVRLLDGLGKEVYRQFLTAAVVNLPASRFAPGVYYMWVMDKEGQPFVQKLLIQ